MLQKISRNAYFLWLSIALITSILFAGLSSANAATPGFTPPENYREDNSLEGIVEPSKNNQEEKVAKDEMDLEEIFGDQQVFPFEMGLGNSAF